MMRRPSRLAGPCRRGGSVEVGHVFINGPLVPGGEFARLSFLVASGFDCTSNQYATLRSIFAGNEVRYIVTGFGPEARQWRPGPLD
jgi:hypothetical protein